MSKYHAQRTTTPDGITFASKREAKRWGELKLLERANEISHLERQPKFPLKVNGDLMFTYIADFAYRDRKNNNERVVEDVKGVRTPVYRMKKKIVEATYNIEIREI